MLSKYSVKKPYTVAVGVIAILVLGVISFMNMTTDLLPSMELPYVIISTTYIGASPEEVEMVVTKPLESGMATVNNIKNITSVSRENASQVVLEFDDGTNMDTAMIEITTRLDLIKPNWSSSVGAPIIMKINPDMMPVMMAAVDVEGMDIYALSDYVSENITPKLEAVNGVASASENGLIEKEITVTISQELIDKVNLIILKDVDAELAEVAEMLNDGERQLREAKSRLAQEGKAGLQKIDDSLKQIEDGKEMLTGSITQLKSQRDALGEQLTQLKAAENMLSAALEQLPSAMTQEQRGALEAMRGRIAVLDAELGAMETELKTVEGRIAQLQEHTPQQGTKQELETLLERRDALTAQLAVKQAEKDGIMGSEAYQGLAALEAADAQRTELTAQLEQTRSAIPQLEQGIAQMDEQIVKLEQGIVPGGVIEGIDEETNINDAEAQLRQTRDQVTEMMSKASGQIAEAQRELGEKRKEFEEQRDEALKKAKIDGIITVQMISQMLTAQNFQMPAGYIEEGEQEFLVRVGDKYTQLHDMENMLLFQLDLESIDEVRLKDVAEVHITDNSDSSYTKVNGNDGVMLSFQKQSTYSTAEVAERLKEKFQELMEENPDVHIVALFDQGVYINIVVNSVLENLMYGAVLAILILLIFLGDFRPTLIIAFSIPISVVAAFVAMYFTNITLNVISLAGLALGVGMLVDNSIVVIENIYRLYEEEGYSLPRACVVGAKQMSGAIFSSTLTTVCVFAPIVFIQGLARQLFQDMGLTIAYSLLASLLVALTLVPAMSVTLLKRQKKRKHRIYGMIQKAYVLLLRGALRAKIVVLIVSVVLLGWSAAQVANMGTAFMPEVDSTQMTATLTLPDNSTFSEQTQMADNVMEVLMDFDDVDTIGVFSGGGRLVTGGMGGGGSSSSMTFYIMLKEDKSMRNEELAARMTEKVDPLGYEVSFSTSNMDITMLYGSGLQVNVKGPEIDTLRAVTSDIAEMMRGIEGTVNVSDGQEKTVPEISIIVDKEAAIAEGLTVAQIYRFVSTTIADGSEVTKMTLEDKEYPVIVVDGENQKLTREDMEELYIEVTKGDETNDIRLGDVCTIEQTDSLASIRHAGQQRVLTASCEIDADHNIGIVGQELSEKLAGYEAPNGYTIEVEGENEAINSTLGDLTTMIALAIVLIYLIMVAQFQSFLSPFIVLFTIPLAFTGGLIALIFAGMEISMIAMLGFLVLSGVVVNNGIVFVDSVNQMRIEGMSKYEALVETGRVRLRPILMTALTTILGMLTIALGTGMGAEMMQPMAVVTIGGLSYATFMTLFIVPVLYDLFNRRKNIKVHKVDLEDGEGERMIEDPA